VIRLTGARPARATRLMTLRAWAGVHPTRSALAVTATAAAMSVLYAQATVSGFGGFRLAVPVPALLLVAVLAGNGAALACDNTARLPLPRPARAIASRGAWALGWTVLAAVAATAGRLVGSPADAGAVVRNVAVYSALGLVMVGLGFASLAWLPAVLLTLAAMVFGSVDGIHFAWWAITMDATVTPRQAVAVAMLFVGSLATYLIFPGRPRWRYRG
jgi:hypothetical protein